MLPAATLVKILARVRNFVSGSLWLVAPTKAYFSPLAAKSLSADFEIQGLA